MDPSSLDGKQSLQMTPDASVKTSISSLELFLECGKEGGEAGETVKCPGELGLWSSHNANFLPFSLMSQFPSLYFCRKVALSAPSRLSHGGFLLVLKIRRLKETW